MRTKSGKIKLLAIALACCLAAACVLLALFPFGPVAYADWGGKEGADLWYFGEDALDVQRAKSVVSKWNTASVKDPIIIAVVDTGIVTSHELFDGVLMKDADGNILGDNSTEPSTGGMVDISDKSDSLHGTAVAGVIAMLIKEMGLENCIKIYPIKASVKGVNDGAQVDSFKIENVTEAIRRASNNVGADVLNLSIGLTRSQMTETQWDTDRQLDYAIEDAAQNMLIVAAAGNNGLRADLPSDNSAFYPAAIEGVFSVMGYAEGGRMYADSNYGKLYDIVAPAQNIYTAAGVYGKDSAYQTISGTSMACAMTSFAAALVKLRYKLMGEELSGHMLSTVLGKLNFDNIVNNTQEMPKLDLYTVATQDLNDIEFDFLPPTGIKISHDGALGTGALEDAIYMRADGVETVNFVARLLPIGETNPEYANYIEWVVVDMFGNETVVGHGAKLKYTASVYGDTRVVARLNGLNLSASQRVFVEYIPYYSGNNHVTFLRNAADESAPKEGIAYTNEAVKFTLVGINFLDPRVEIKWYVDRQYVASGRVFEYKPTKAGDHIISAQYGDNAPAFTGGDSFTVHVKPFILRPLDLSMLIVGLVVAASAGGVAIAIAVRRKRAGMSEEELAARKPKPRPEREKKPKRDRKIKVAKR